MKKIIATLSVFITLLFAQNSCETRFFTLESKPGISIGEIINNISDECDYTVLLKDKFAKKKMKERLGKLSLKKVTLDTLLNVILLEHNLDYTLVDNILSINYLITKTFKIDYVTTKRVGQAVTDASVDIGGVSQADGGGVSAGTSTKTRDVNIISSKDEFDFWKNIQQEIYDILNRPSDEYNAPKPIVNANAGLVTVTGTRKQIERVATYIDELEDRMHKEVLIDVSILAVFLNKNITTGIDWSRFSLTLNGEYDANGNFSPTNPLATYQSVGVGTNFKNIDYASTATAIINSSLNLSGLIDFLQKDGKVVTLSNPKILTLNNQPAIITIGDNINYNVPTSITIGTQGDLGEKAYTPSSIFVGILLNITPEITDDNEIILRINPSISELRNPDDLTLKGTSSFREIAPDTKEKKISSVVKVRDGSTLILGGLISNTKNFMINGVPLIKDIPLFGNLFKSKKRENQRFELIFVLKPKIIKSNKDMDISLKDLGYRKLTYEK
ncbi:pilus (MSHA type) biogenesis protein MshL [Nitratiruptor tergarcus]|uniref:General secretion pathway protein D n=1 Tax=Nitratiruptor tergarcus DSM 16512 TaxID=1069081 RepID=A0A1W1WTV5_9BACT|nr:pilus (MSHA type) biogenesis protein MshL [Nitratiruptor tergarcus]SMC09632.1 general secretion pathway protein D [Nitratiruptor tergarcus DSM 16512]